MDFCVGFHQRIQQFKIEAPEVEHDKLIHSYHALAVVIILKINIIGLRDR